MRKYPTIDIFIAQRLLLVDAESCWEYPAAKMSTGYAHYKLNGVETGAHRAAYEAMYGHPGAALVCHTCDNRACANPFHLFPCTYKDNARDAMAKDRHCHGERNGSSKMTADQVRAILADKRSQTTIAGTYGISQSAVSDIKRGHHWRALR